MKKFKTMKNSFITKKFKVSFDYDIQDVKTIEDMYLVLLKVPKGSLGLDNLFGVTEDGKIEWRVQSATEIIDWNIKKNSPYVFLNVFEDNVVKINNFMGIQFEVDYRTGKLVSKEIIK